MRFFLRAISFFRKDWALITVFLALVVVSIGIGVMQAWPMAVLVDVVLTPTPTAYSWPHKLFLGALPHNRLGVVIGVTLIGMSMKIAQDSLGAIKILLNNRFTFNGRLRVRTVLYRKLQQLNIAYHRSLPQGDAIYRVLSDSVGCDQILNVILNSLIAGVTLVAMVGIMLSRNVPLTISLVAPFRITNNYFGKRIKSSSIATKQSETRLTTLVQRAMSSIGLVQAFNRQRSEYHQFGGAAVDCRFQLRSGEIQGAVWFRGADDLHLRRGDHLWVRRVSGLLTGFCIPRRAASPAAI